MHGSKEGQGDEHAVKTTSPGHTMTTVAQLKHLAREQVLWKPK